MFNYKNVFSLTIVLILLLTVGVFAQQFEDVPRDHWAYDSVQTLAEKGYLSLYSGEDFNGEEALTRYEMAEIIANVLNNTTGTSTAQNLSDEDVDVIRELSLEFRDELVAVAERQKNFEQKLKSLEDNNQIQNEDISNLNLRLSEMQDNYQQSIEEIDTKIADLESKINTLETKGASGQKLQDLEDNQSVALTRINELESRIEELEAEKEAMQAEDEDGGSLNAGYVLGALALIALVL